MLIPQGKKIYTRNEDKMIQNKIRQGQNKSLKDDTICNNYTPRTSDRPIQIMQICIWIRRVT